MLDFSTFTNSNWIAFYSLAAAIISLVAASIALAWSIFFTVKNQQKNDEKIRLQDQRTKDEFQDLEHRVNQLEGVVGYVLGVLETSKIARRENGVNNEAS